MSGGGQGATAGGWHVCLSRAADKAQKGLDKPLRLVLLEALKRIEAAPQQVGERLCQPLIPLYSHHVGYQGREYRIAYQVDEVTQVVMVLLIGPHENFYKRLKLLFYR